MRLEETEKPDVAHVWMDDSEFEQLWRAGATHRDEVVVQLAGSVGLRAFEIPQICPKHVRRTEDGEHYRLRVPRGKGTTGKPRDAFLPSEVERDLHRQQTAQDIPPDEPFIDLAERSLRAVVKRTAQQAAEETGDEDFEYVSYHDLRRRFAQRLLVDENMNPRVVLQVGGWRSFESIKSFFAAPTTDVVTEAFEDAGLS